MVNARPPYRDDDPDEGLRAPLGQGASWSPDGDQPRPAGRFNVLLTEDRTRPDEHWTRQFPRLMEPLGVSAHVAGTAKEALDLAHRVTFHVAFIDLATPVGKSPAADRSTDIAGGGGLWLLQVLRRLEHHPPVIMVNSRATQQQAVRLLNEALRLGAFSVVNRPTHLNALLTVVQRLLDRQYKGQWPPPKPPTP